MEDVTKAGTAPEAALVVSKEQTSPHSSYGKRSWKKWILIYAVIGAVFYAGIYFLFLSKHASNPYSTNYPKPTVASQLTPRTATSSDETANWKTYNFADSFSSNEQNPQDYHFSVKYPSDWRYGPGYRPGFVSSDYQEPATGAVETVLSGARIRINVIQKPPEFSTLTDWFNNFYIDPKSHKTLYTPTQVMINAGAVGKVQGLQYNNVAYVTNPDSEGNLLVKLFAYNNVVYEFHLVSKDDSIKWLPILNNMISTFKFTDQNQANDLTKIFNKLSTENKVKACHYYDNCFPDIFSDNTKREIAYSYSVIDQNDNKSTIYIGLLLGKSVDVSGIGTQYIENKNFLNLKSDDWYWEIGACPSNKRIFVNAVTGEKSPMHKFVYCGGVE